MGGGVLEVGKWACDTTKIYSFHCIFRAPITFDSISFHTSNLDFSGSVAGQGEITSGMHLLWITQVQTTFQTKKKHNHETSSRDSG